MKTFSAFFLLPFFFAVSLFGEAPLSLAELVDIALKNNPETQKVWWNTKRAQAVVGIAKSPLYPAIDGQASINHGREVKFPNGPNTNYTVGGGELFLNYLLFDFGERSATIQATKTPFRLQNGARTLPSKRSFTRWQQTIMSTSMLKSCLPLEKVR